MSASGEELGGDSGPTHRRAAPEQRPDGGTPQDAAPAATKPKDKAGPTAIPWTRKKRRETFAGDVQIVQLRTRLAGAPDRIAEPSSPAPTRKSGGAIRALGIVVTVMLAAAAGYMWSQTTHWPAAPVPDRIASNPPGSAPVPMPASPPATRSAQQPEPVTPPNVNGLAPAGGEATPNLAPVEKPKVAAVIPPRRTDPADIAAMMKQGEIFMANADIAGARLIFKRAAESGDAAATFALAETYDPFVLEKSGMRGGIVGDAATARTLYEKALELGSTAASERLSRLATVGP
jgi:hypothetical protein